ncbi:hypothetical protein Pcinc_004901 [Petrolisthes cinctipes]|uniref:Uncharacterized protein n=1 Tax=Petrolisthes cinctipes TaxID=88211 RepID=A0AAE1GG52_PETCI|nr:hypothetical protein Pcinc_004901 [Petrolisthes cinctipes]
MQNVKITYHEHQCNNGEEERDFSSDFNESEAEDELANLEGDDRPMVMFRTNSHFTSSVLYRNQGLTSLDDCFEFIREYQEEHVGALVDKDVEGWVEEESPLFRQAMRQT